ncbi:MAG TPA: hypothetical protein VGD71_04265 [Kribbella sp.]
MEQRGQQRPIWRGEIHPLLAEWTFQYGDLMPQGEDFHVLVPVAIVSNRSTVNAFETAR